MSSISNNGQSKRFSGALSHQLLLLLVAATTAGLAMLLGHLNPLH